MTKYHTDPLLFPRKLLIDGSVSRLAKLPGGSWARVRKYPTGKVKWTWNRDQDGKKRDVVGTLRGDRFVPASERDAYLIETFHSRILAPSQGCMEVAHQS